MAFLTVPLYSSSTPYRHELHLKKRCVFSIKKKKQTKKHGDVQIYLLYLGVLWFLTNSTLVLSFFVPSSPGFLLLFEGFKTFTSQVPTFGGVILQVAG